jgi:two-component system response regulator YesN
MMSVKISQVESPASGLKKLDHSALRQFLETGLVDDFDAFFAKTVLPLAEAGLRSSPLKHYIIVDIELAVAQFVSDLGGDTRQIFPIHKDEDQFLAALQTLDQIRAETRRLFTEALVYRDSQVGNDRSTIIRRARQYIDEHFSDSDLSLNEIAAEVGFSPNHFSAVFSAETGGTFRDYLTRTRIEHAKKLLSSSRLKCSEVAFQCGYNDPHYFSVIFRKNDGMTPQQFRGWIRKQGSAILTSRGR